MIPTPGLKKNRQFIRHAIEAGIPVLGVCLGSQFMAKALGGKVRPGPRLEIGPTPITRTVEEDADAVFGTFPRQFTVFEWHGEGLTLPPGACVLASSEFYPVQAFRYGDRAYGLLFHLELEVEGVEALCRECVTDVQRAQITTEALLESAGNVLPECHRLADRLIAHLAT